VDGRWEPGVKVKKGENKVSQGVGLPPLVLGLVEIESLICSQQVLNHVLDSSMPWGYITTPPCKRSNYL